MTKNILVILLIIFFPIIIKAQTIDWETETGSTAPFGFYDGQLINDFGGTGLNVRINVNIVIGQPKVIIGLPTVVYTAGTGTDCRFMLTFLNGSANIRLNNYQNLLSGEQITISNPDMKDITIRQTTNNGGGRMTIDGITVPALNTDVVQDDNAIINEVNDGAGTRWYATMNDITSFTWEYDAVTGTTGTEGFILTLSSIVLPIELVSFSSKITMENNVILNWETASETNNNFFIIERSKEGTDWQEVEKVNGAGNSTSLLRYSFTDNTPFSGTSYYRLKQTDFDGKFEYSEITTVNFDKTISSQIQIYPNPTDNKINIIGEESDLNELKIYNILGQDITSETIIITTEKPSQVEMDLSKLNKGMYIIKTRNTINKVYKN